MGVKVVEMASLANIRRDQNTLSGYKLADTINMAMMQVTTGMDMTAWFLRYILYMLSVNWATPGTTKPLSCHGGKHDNAIYTAPIQPVLGYNNSPIFGEDCSGATSVFPFRDATDEPVLNFWSTLSDIPTDRRASVLTIHPAMLQSTDVNPQLNLALLILGWCDYPCGLHTVTVNATDRAGANAAAKIHIPWSALVGMKGLSNIDVLIPRGYPSNDPTDQGGANSIVSVQPGTGPTIATDPRFTANTLLNVNFSGGTAEDYPLAQFLYTWLAMPLSPLDTTVLSRWISQAANLMGRWKDLEAAWHLASVLSVRYPVMQSSGLTTAAAPFAANSVGQYRATLFNAIQPHTLTADIPLPLPPLWDFQLGQLQTTIWNKVMIGVATAIGDGLIAGELEFMGTPYMHQYSMYITRAYAATWAVMARYLGWGVDTWNSSFTNTNLVGVRQLARNFFVKPGDQQVNVAPAGSAMEGLMVEIVGARPALDSRGYSLWAYMTIPRVGFSGIVRTPAVELLLQIPVTLPDIWFQLSVITCPKSMSPFLQIYNKMSGLKAPGCSIMALAAAGDYSIPVTIQRQARNFGIKQLPRTTDAEDWNTRLALAYYNGNIFTTDGVAVAAAHTLPGDYVCQKWMIADYTMVSVANGQVQSAFTPWHPICLLDGRNVIAGVTAANNADEFTRTLCGRNFIGMPVWQINNVAITPSNINEVEGWDDMGIHFYSGNAAPPSSAGLAVEVENGTT
jgi:hypothetical protein